MGRPAVVWLTTLARIVGQVRVVRSLTGAFQLGLIALNLLFVVIGIGSRLAGLLGYAVGNYAGLLVAAFVHSWG